MAENANDLVSVIIPTYNDDEYLSRAVKSVISQKYDEMELLLIDSSDSSVAVSLADTYSSIQRITTPPNGPAAARNAGIEEARGEYIAFLDADDEWLPNKITTQVTTLESTEASFVFSEEYIEREGSRRKHSTGITFPDEEPVHEYYFRKGTGIGSRTVMVRSECLECHRFNEQLDAREDPHLWTRILRDYDPVKISEPLAIKHLRNDSLTADHELVWKNERDSINDLADHYEELEPYRSKRLSEADYRFAKRLLRDGMNVRARKRLHQLDQNGVRVLSLIATSYLPIGHQQAVDGLDTIYRHLM